METYFIIHSGTKVTIHQPKSKCSLIKKALNQSGVKLKEMTSFFIPWLWMGTACQFKRNAPHFECFSYSVEWQRKRARENGNGKSFLVCLVCRFDANSQSAANFSILCVQRVENAPKILEILRPIVDCQLAATQPHISLTSPHSNNKDIEFGVQAKLHELSVVHNK